MTRPGATAGPSERALAWLYLGGGLIGLLAAAVLLIEKIALLEDPSSVPSCSINPILSCGSIMKTDQAELFGFPNPILGVAGFPFVIASGAGLLAGATFRRWYWLGLQIGATAGLALVHWLIFQSLYRIDALCPYCMVVWAVTIPVFWYTTLHNANSWAATRSQATPTAIRFVTEYHGAILTAWYLAITALIANRFWDYWSTLLP